MSSFIPPPSFISLGVLHEAETPSQFEKGNLNVLKGLIFN